jgi:hypothetical protein
VLKEDGRMASVRSETKSDADVIEAEEDDLENDGVSIVDDDEPAINKGADFRL